MYIKFSLRLTQLKQQKKAAMYFCFLKHRRSNGACQQKQPVKKASQQCPASLSALINPSNKVLNRQGASHHPRTGYNTSEYMKIKNEETLLFHYCTIKTQQGKISLEYNR